MNFPLRRLPVNAQICGRRDMGSAIQSLEGRQAALTGQLLVDPLDCHSLHAAWNGINK